MGRSLDVKQPLQVVNPTNSTSFSSSHLYSSPQLVVFLFSKDVYAVDELIPRTLSSFLQTLVQSIGSFVIIIYGTAWFAAVVVPLLVLYYLVQVYLLCCR